MSWIYYLLEANLYLIAFYALYYLLFRVETYYQLNRVYLLVSTVLAFVIPLIRIGILQQPIPQLQSVTAVHGNFQAMATSVQLATNTNPLPVVNYYLLIYCIVALLLFINLILKVYKLIRLSYINKTNKNDDFTLVEISGEVNAFSFFNYLFISPGLTPSSTILHHELIHIKQRHSLDIIYLELLKIINWFNPFVYMLQNSMKEVHEFIADSKTVDKETSAEIYTDFLVNNAYGIDQNVLINTFFNKSLLKKRIMMLHQKKSGRAARLKYLVVLPLILGLLCASTLAFAKDYGWIDLAPGNHPPLKSVEVGKKVPSSITDTLTLKSDTIKTISKYKHKPSRNFNYKSATKVTSKGYKYEEDGYLINHKSNFRVIITENNGEQKEYYKNSTSTAQLNLLKEKYGYSFPNMEIFDRLPPPPPMPGPAMPPPPPPAAPVAKPAPPQKPSASTGDVKLDEKSAGSKNNKILNLSNVTFSRITYQPGSKGPIIVQNNKIVDLQPLPNGKAYQLHADSIRYYQHDNEKGIKFAMQKWGDRAKNGVIEAFGNVKIDTFSYSH